MKTIDINEEEEIMLKNVLVDKIIGYCYINDLGCKSIKILNKYEITELIEYLKKKYTSRGEKWQK